MCTGFYGGSDKLLAGCVGVLSICKFVYGDDGGIFYVTLTFQGCFE